MLALLRVLFHVVELLLALPLRVLRYLFFTLTTRPHLGPLRHVVTAAIAYGAFALLLVYVAAPIEASRGNISSPTSCATTPNAGSQPPSTMPAAASSAPSIRASIASATSTTRTRHQARRLHRQPRSQVDPGARGAGALLAMPRPTTRTAISAALVNPYGIDLVGVLKIPLLDDHALDRAAAAEPRHGRLDAAHAVRARDLQYAAEPRRGRRHQAQSASSRNGGWPRSSIAS